MIAAQSLPALPTRPIKAGTAVVPAGLRALAFRRLADARARGTVSDAELVQAAKSGDEGVASLLMAKSALPMRPALSRVNQDPLHKPSIGENLKGAVELLEALRRHGDVDEGDLRASKAKNPLITLAEVIAKGLDRRRRRLTADIPRATKGQAFIPFTVVPVRLASMIGTVGDVAPGTCIIELVGHPAINLPIAEADEALAIEQALGKLAQAVPFLGSFISGPSHAQFHIGGYYYETMCDMAASYARNKRDLKQLVLEYADQLESEFGHDLSDPYVQQSILDSIANIEALGSTSYWKPQSRKLGNWLRHTASPLREPIQHLRDLAQHARKRKLSLEGFYFGSEEYGQSPTVLMLDMARSNYFSSLDHYGMDGFDNLLLGCVGDETADAELRAFDRAVMEVSYITSALQAFT